MKKRHVKKTGNGNKGGSIFPVSGDASTQANAKQALDALPSLSLVADQERRKFIERMTELAKYILGETEYDRKPFR